MSKNYKQLSSEQRYQIEALKKAGNSQKETALIIGVHPSTISRELRRNTPKRGRGALNYQADIAQRRTVVRHRSKPKWVRFTEEMKQFARDKLTVEKLSPELIHHVGKLELGDFVSHETLYNWIWCCKKSNVLSSRKDKLLYRHLAHGKRRRKRGNHHDSRGIIQNRVPIEKRPKIVARRKRVGDFEIDLMMGRRDTGGAIVVTTDRATLLTKLQLLDSKETRIVGAAIKNKLRSIRKYVKTLTFDNDQAFQSHQKVGKYLDARTYFTRPYTSQDKGTVENRIGVLRRFFPKKTDLSKINPSEVRRVEKLLNNRPVRKFNYKTPNQVFSEKIALIS
jgi:transposase, IS30 family